MRKAVERIDDEQCWAALIRRDLRADGTFVYGVRTTGVYCRPICKSRRPTRHNVVFFGTWAEAERAGFRACKRCAPRTDAKADKDAETMVAVCRRIEQAGQPPSLAELAKGADLSPSHFHREFKRIVGVTPKQYAAGQRSQRFRQALDKGRSVTRASHEAGYSSSSRSHEAAKETLGMTPTRYKEGGEGLRIRTAARKCSLGWVMVAATQRGVCAIEFDDQPQVLRDRLRARFFAAEIVEDDPTFSEWVSQVLAHVESPANRFDVPLDIQGTAFQQKVWAALRATRPGRTTTYTEIAKQVGQPAAIRAVASACADNAIAVAIPCHRVVRSDGGLGGYRWGLHRKRALLEKEAKP